MRRFTLFLLAALFVVSCSALARSQQEAKDSGGKMPPAEAKAAPCVKVSKEEMERNDTRVASFVEAVNALTTELVKKVETGSNPSDGIDAAQRYMDSMKPRIRAQFESVEGIGECQVNEQTKKTLSDDFYNDGVKLGQLQQKYGKDDLLRNKLQKLTQDFLNTLTSSHPVQGTGEIDVKTGRNVPSLEKSLEASASRCKGATISAKELAQNDEKINAFAVRITAFTDEIVKRVDAASNPSAGVDAAQTYFDTEKAKVRAHFDSVKNVSECQVSNEAKKKLSDDLYQVGVKLGRLQVKYGSDLEVKAKLKKLTQDFLDMLKG
jgi:hypothetical protein